MSETLNDLLLQSPDHNAERLAELKRLMPDLFTAEGHLDTRELQKLANPDSVQETERYEFRWFGKSNAKRNAFTPSNATLVYDEKRSVNPGTSENLIIEGENLEVLKLLSGSYREKIKCIYIDPPYNTGKDFVYSDNYTQDKRAYWEEAGVTENGVKIDTNSEADGRYHSNWLNMMYSRLLLARHLLRDDGVIFISIDDNEVHHLRKLCDEVFGEENFIGQIVLQTATDNNPTQIATEHEYIICYAKEKDKQKYWGRRSEAAVLIQFKYEELKANFGNDTTAIQKQLREWINRNKSNLPRITHYDNVDEKGVFHDGDAANTIYGGYEYEVKHPRTGEVCKPPEKGYRFTQQTFEEMAALGDIMFGEDHNTIIKPKFRLENAKDLLRTVIYEDGRASTKAVDELIGRSVFENPKSHTILNRLFSYVLKDNRDTVLDFFAGSGTTGQAVMELNSDNIERRFILIQIPETTKKFDKKGKEKPSAAYKAGYKTISDITIERNKRVVQKLIDEKKAKNPDLFTDPKQAQSLEGLGFKVFKLQKSNFPRVDFAPDPDKTEADNLEALRRYIAEKEAQLVGLFDEDQIITEILIKHGFTLQYTLDVQPTFRFNRVLLAEDGERTAFVTLDNRIDPKTVEYLRGIAARSIQKPRFICLERALDTTTKFTLKQILGEQFRAL